MNKRLAALAVAALIAGCGGGSDSNAPATPQAAIAALMATKMPMAVSATEAAEQLMNAGEAAYPGYFPSHQTTQTMSPFRFRYYPETGIYLGVVVEANATYALHHVYVAGGAFGTLANPTDMGPLTNYISVDIGNGGGGGGSASACFDLSLNEIQGTRSIIDYTYSGTITGTEHIDSTVGGMVAFEGTPRRETTVVTTGTHTTQGQTLSINTTGKNYASTSSNSVTQYGSVLTASSNISGFTANITTKVVYNPPYVDTQYQLTAGQSVTLTMAGVVTSTTSITGAPVPIPDQVNTTQISGSTTHKFVGTESVTVPAGTYNSCKFEVTDSGTTTTSWIVLGKGIPVKITGGGQTIQATSVTVNGAPI